MGRVRNNFCLLSLIVLLGCTNQFRPTDTVARVNGEAITVKDFRSLHEILKPKELSQATKESGQVKNLVLKTLVRRLVILTEAKRKSISVSESELEEAVAKYKQGYTSEIFHENLLEQMVDENEWKEQIRQNLLIAKIFDAAEVPKPTLKMEDALSFYERNPMIFHQTAQATALHIVVAERSKAEEIRKALMKNPKDFLTLARKFSTGPEAQEEAKIRVSKGALPIELDRVLFESPIGAFSPIVQSVYGFHIVRVMERTPEMNKDFEQAKSEIMKRLQFEQRMNYLSKFEEDLLRSAQIEYNRELIRLL